MADRTIDFTQYERWADIQDDPRLIVLCADKWKRVAQSIGCTLHGFNDGRSATFETPDGTMIEVGPHFRSTLEAISQERDK